jgi:hypothetical protein
VAEADAMTQEWTGATPWRRWYALALVYAQAIQVLEKDLRLSPDERRSLAERYTTSALSCLDKARTLAPEAEWKAQEPKLTEEFESLAQREAFRQWLKHKPSPSKR